MLGHRVRVALIGVLAPCDPIQLYGNEIRFDVERDGKPIGQHVVTFTRTKDGIQTESRADVQVNLLFLTAYRLRYQARELWSDGELKFIEASTNDNGDYTHVQAVRDAAGLEISSPHGIYEAPSILPISHWNAALLKGGQMLDTITGELAEVQLFHQGLLIPSRRVTARCGRPTTYLFRRSQWRDLVR